MLARRIGRALLPVVALLFSGATALYSFLWMRGAANQPGAFLGVESSHQAAAAAQRISKVRSGTPAERAGLAPGDRILAIDGRPLEAATAFNDALVIARPGDRVRLLVDRDGTRLVVEAVLAPPPAAQSEATPARRLVDHILNLYPVL